MFKAIANTFSNCFKIPELKSRILFTLMLLAICRLVAWVPVPGLDGMALREWFDEVGRQSSGQGVLGMYSLFTGGALQKCAIGALGIMPYITATIIIQLLTTVVPSLAKAAREEGGRAQIIKYGRYLTVLLCLGHGTLMTIGWENPGKMFNGFTGNLVLIENIWWYRVQTILILTTGTMLLMWLGEQITERGIGNGVSLVITIGIVADLPMAAQAFSDMFWPAAGNAQFNYFHMIFLALLLVVVVGGIVAVTQAQRKIPVQYAQRAVGRKVYAGGSSFMPLRVNYAGVMPVIFAGAILMFPAKLLMTAGEVWDIKVFIEMGRALEQGHFTYYILYALMILFFSYFWVATQFNEIQIADDLKKHGGYIPGVRPGQATSDFLHRTMSRITLAGAVFLTIIALLPQLMGQMMNINPMVSQFFGGTSMLITVGVLLDTMRQMETHLLMRHYDGFLKKGRIKGRF